MLGLCVILVACSTPVSGLDSFARFLLTSFWSAPGAAILQVAGNPIMRDVSGER